MIIQEGNLRKMEHKFDAPIQYFLITKINDEKFSTNLNSFVGQKLILEFTLDIYCIYCGKKTKKSFSQGSCYSCFIKLATNDMCILKPETCHFHMGTCREPKWGEENCFKTHKVYFSDTGVLKVGISRENPISKRWIDQGANLATEFLEVNSRLDAGLMEHTLKDLFADKTNWRKMLKNESVTSNFDDVFKKAKDYIKKNIQQIHFKFLENNPIQIFYPVKSFPNKVKSYSISKNPKIEDILMGIKGQYLIFESGVLNIRSHAGYYIKLYQ